MPGKLFMYHSANFEATIVGRAVSEDVSRVGSQLYREIDFLRGRDRGCQECGEVLLQGNQYSLRGSGTF